MKSLLFHISQLPYSSIAIEEEIETILFAGSFGYHVTVLFSEKGIFQLHALQRPRPGQKNISKMIAAFPTFEISKIYVCAEDLNKYALHQTELAINAQLISRGNINKLIQQFDIIMNY